MSNLCNNNIPGPLADSYCNNLLNELDNFRNSNSLSQCQSNMPLSIGDGADAWENKVFQSTRIITTIEESTFITDVILNHAKDENKQVVISVDCEGVNLGIKGKITLITIGTTQGEAFMFDTLICPEMVKLGGLKSILEHEKIIKIIHAAENDSLNLVKQFGVQLKNVFDTQIANSVIFYQKKRRPQSKFQLVSLNGLCKNYNVSINPMKDIFKDIYRKNRKYWGTRPLTREMFLYAASDVLVLINKQLYENMAKSIYPSSQSIFSRKCSKKIGRFYRKKNAEKLQNSSEPPK